MAVNTGVTSHKMPSLGGGNAEMVGTDKLPKVCHEHWQGWHGEAKSRDDDMQAACCNLVHC